MGIALGRCPIPSMPGLGLCPQPIMPNVTGNLPSLWREAACVRAGLLYLADLLCSLQQRRRSASLVERSEADVCDLRTRLPKAGAGDNGTNRFSAIQTPAGERHE
jgi:hypothetical protein